MKNVYTFLKEEIMEKKLSSAEHYLWGGLIQNHIDQIGDMSIVKLSEYANVSTATIVRTMKKKDIQDILIFVMNY